MKINLTLAGAAFEAEGDPAEVQACFAVWLSTVQAMIVRATTGAPIPATTPAVTREMH